MNEREPSPNTAPANLDGWVASGYKNAQLNYILYLLSFIFGFTSIVGLIFAYVNRDQADEIVYSHYQYQIRTFWIGLLFGVISFFLTFVFIGILTFLLLSIWWLVRSIKGLMLVSRQEPITNVNTWLF